MSVQQSPGGRGRREDSLLFRELRVFDGVCGKNRHSVPVLVVVIVIVRLPFSHCNRTDDEAKDRGANSYRSVAVVVYPERRIHPDDNIPVRTTVRAVLSIH